MERPRRCWPARSAHAWEDRLPCRPAVQHRVPPSSSKLIPSFLPQSASSRIATRSGQRACVFATGLTRMVRTVLPRRPADHQMHALLDVRPFKSLFANCHLTSLHVSPTVRPTDIIDEGELAASAENMRTAAITVSGIKRMHGTWLL